MNGGVVFDHDRTLVNSLAVVVQASNRVLSAFGRGPRPAAEIVAGMVHATAPRLGLLAEITDPSVQMEMAGLYGDLALRSSELAVLYPGVAEMLTAVEGRGFSLAVWFLADRWHAPGPS